MSSIIKKFIGTNEVGASQIRLENTSFFRARDFSNTTDLNLLRVNSSDQFEITQNIFLNKANPFIQTLDVLVGSSESVNITTGQNASTGNSGSISLTTGVTAAGGFPGFIFLQPGSDGSGAYGNVIVSGGLNILNPYTAVRIYGDNAGFPVPLEFWDLATSGYVGFQAPNSVTTSTIWTLPDQDGSAGQVLSTDGSGNLSWVTSASAPTTFSDAVFRIYDDVTVTKQLAFEVSAISAATTRTITVPDADLNLSTSTSGSFANVTLSNLGTTAINQNLNFAGVGFWAVITQNQTGATASVNCGYGSGSSVNANSGISNFRSGAVTGTGASGAVNLNTGNVSAGTGASGQVNINTGTSAGGVTGQISIATGATTGANQSGQYAISTGTCSGTGNSGPGFIRTGALNNVGTTGALNFGSGNQSGAGNSGASSNNSGSVTSGTSGSVTIASGFASTTGSTGNLLLQTGNCSASGTSGDIQLTTGTTAGTRGAITAQSSSMTFTSASLTLTSSGSNQQLRFVDVASSFYSAFKAGSLAASTTWTLPLADGTNGQILKTDGAGNLAWVNNTAMPFIGARYTCTAVTSQTTTYAILKYPTVSYDPTSIYNTTTGIATITTAGKYLVSASVNLSQGSQPILSLAIYKNGSLYSEWVSQYSASTVPITCLITDTLDLAIGDTVAIYHKNSVGAVNISTSPGRNFFNILKVD